MKPSRPAREVVRAPELARAEAKLGLRLPSLLRTYYTRVANGGVGPFGGLLGLSGGFTDDNGRDAVALVERWRKLPNRAWPKGLYFLAYTGCSNYLCVDLSKAAAPVVEFDASLLDFERVTPAAVRDALAPRAPSLEAWLEKHAKPLLKTLLTAEPEGPNRSPRQPKRRAHD